MHSKDPRFDGYNRNHEAMLHEAQRRTLHNEDALRDSSISICVFCGHLFGPDSIVEDSWPDGTWVDDGPIGGRTATCPKCHVDAVLPQLSGLPIFDPEFLTLCRREWWEGYALGDNPIRCGDTQVVHLSVE